MNYQDIFDTVSPGSFKKHSDETRAQMRASRSQLDKEVRLKLSNAKLKPIMTPNGVFPSRSAVAAAADVNATTVSRWLKKFPNDYYYITTPAK
jgi:transposase-like protein